MFVSGWSTRSSEIIPNDHHMLFSFARTGQKLMTLTCLIWKTVISTCWCRSGELPRAEFGEGLPVAAGRSALMTDETFDKKG